MKNVKEINKTISIKKILSKMTKNALLNVNHTNVDFFYNWDLELNSIKLHHMMIYKKLTKINETYLHQLIVYVPDSLLAGSIR